MFQSITSIVGTEKASDDLIKRLSTPNDTAKMLKMVAVVGFGGLGKTTLAKVVFHRIRNLFDCSCFVPVGRKPNLKKVFKYICTRLKMKVQVELDECQMIDRLRNFLSGEKKRYCMSTHQVKCYCYLMAIVYIASCWNI
jgi:Holliday junction resolvasome RuvABC ATP-dependent DNA helicase subunit